VHDDHLLRGWGKWHVFVRQGLSREAPSLQSVYGGTLKSASYWRNRGGRRRRPVHGPCRRSRISPGVYAGVVVCKTPGLQAGLPAFRLCRLEPLRQQREHLRGAARTTGLHG
jgi:hypothetical protein